VKLLAVKLLAGFSGILQVDGYSVYKQLIQPTREGGAVTLAYCWSHLRRKSYEVYVGSPAPIATEALARIKLLYEIETDIRGLPPELQRAVRQEKSKPVIGRSNAYQPRLATSSTPLRKAQHFI
jgi:hypothetical protein